MKRIKIKQTIGIMEKKAILFLMPEKTVNSCFSKSDIQRLSKYGKIIYRNSEDAISSKLKPGEISVLVTGWGTKKIRKEFLNKMMGLELIVHSAGTVKAILPDDFWERKIKIATCNHALAIGVAEMNLGLMIAAGKRFWEADRITSSGEWYSEEFVSNIKEMYNIKIGIIAASRVGRHLIKLLKNFDVEILLYDPYCSQQAAEELRVKKVYDLMKLANECDFINLCAPVTEQTKGMLTAEFFKVMKDDAVFINTARGILIDENALIDELEKGRLFACLDVTEQEPPDKESKLRKLPNVILTPHIAGHANNAKKRQGKFAVDEIIRFIKKEPLVNKITEDQVKIMG